ERGRAGDDGGGKIAAVRQRLAALDIDHHRFGFFQPGGDADPVRETAVAAQGRERLPGFDDQKRLGFHSGGGRTDRTSSIVVSPCATFSSPVRRSVRSPSARAALLNPARSMSRVIRARSREPNGSSSYRPTRPM